jgi:hypothetical protein
MFQVGAIESRVVVSEWIAGLAGRGISVTLVTLGNIMTTLALDEAARYSGVLTVRQMLLPPLKLPPQRP